MQSRFRADDSNVDVIVDPNFRGDVRSAASQSALDLPLPDVDQAGDDFAFCLSDHHIIEEIDADAMLERGVHPIGRIRKAVKALGRGEVVLLTSSFRPEPLIETMRRSGSAVHTSIQGTRHLTYFAGSALM
ncbi:MAG TPA: hypothetical protein VHW09_30620 [Bryobacteraceae bacterium]|jgi:hypothetical protein|nr:hypothetical protein [Bryobacteraceae bacterium]